MKKIIIQNSISNIKWFGCLILFIIISYLPVTSFQFAIKNDFFQAYFPVKYFLSSSIKAGEWPIWNPFLNYGFPSYGDMSASYWNPLTWIFAAIGYNAYVFTAEQLIYMFLAGIGMFLLMSRWTDNHYVKFIVAASYVCSGFTSSHQQHFNWINAVGILPFCIHWFLRFIENTCSNNALKFILALTIFFTAVHPGMIIGLILILFFFTLIFRNDINARGTNVKSILFYLSIFGVLIAGMVYGYAEVIFETNRSNPISSQTGTQGSTHVTNWVSFLLPLTINDKSGLFNNELTLRNCYLGLIMMALIIYSIFSTSNIKNVRSFILTGFFFMLLSSDIIHSIYDRLPLINFVRLNGEFRLFGMFCLLIAGGIQLNELIKIQNQKFIKLLKFFLIILLCIIIALFILMQFDIINIQFSISELKSKDAIKIFLDHFNWKQALIIQCILQSFFLIGLISSYKNYNIKLFTIFIALDLIINTLIQLPFTTIGRTKLDEIQKMVDKAPEYPQIPYYESESAITKNYPSTEKYIGGWGFYSKQVALDDNLYYPLMLSSNLQYFKNGTQKKLHNKGFIFSEKNHTSYQYTKAGYIYWQLKSNSSSLDTLIVKQNSFKGWRVNIDGKDVPVFKTETSLSGFTIQPGKHVLNIQYKRDSIKYLLLLQWAAFIFVILLLIRNYRIKYILP